MAYRVAAAEESGLDDHSVDIVTVAQALHWFDIPAFFEEARRVLKPNGIIAIWSYNLLAITPEIDLIISHFYGVTVGRFWPPERKLVEAGYADLPFQAIRSPNFKMKVRWTLPQLLGYIRTWSATQKYIANNRTDPLEALQERISPIWGTDEARPIVWPLSLLVGRN